MDINKLTWGAGFDVRKWANQRKRHNRLSESFVRSYVSSHLRDIRLGGRAEAERMIDKLILGKRMELSAETLNLIANNRAKWADFAYKIASTLDIDALVGFFVPFIYGGFITRKNQSGEAFGVINISENRENADKSARFSAILSAVERFRRRGIGIIVVKGALRDVYSERMFSLYQSAKNECFIIIEGQGDARGGGDLPRESLYGREVLSALGRAKNVFIVLGEKSVGEGELLSRSRALSSFGVLHGAYIGKASQNALKELGKGSCMAIFDQNIAFGVDIWSDFISFPCFPLLLPELFESLRVLQHLSSLGVIGVLGEENI